jgi:hypothetical protein
MRLVDPYKGDGASTNLIFHHAQAILTSNPSTPRTFPSLRSKGPLMDANGRWSSYKFRKEAPS